MEIPRVAPRSVEFAQFSYRSTHDVLQDVLQEVSLLSKLRDENIVGYVGSAVFARRPHHHHHHHGVRPQGLPATHCVRYFTALDVGHVQRYVRDIFAGAVISSAERRHPP